MSRIIMASIAAAIVMLAATAALWVLTPLPKMFMLPPTDEAAATSAIKQFMPDSGYYVIPAPVQDNSDPVRAAKLQAGPIATVAINYKGVDPKMTDSYIFGFLHYLVLSFIAVLLLTHSNWCDTHERRMIFISMVGLLVSIGSEPYYAIWGQQPWNFHLMNMGFTLIGWFLASYVVAKIIDPARIPGYNEMAHKF